MYYLSEIKGHRNYALYEGDESLDCIIFDDNTKDSRVVNSNDLFKFAHGEETPNTYHYDKIIGVDLEDDVVRLRTWGVGERELSKLLTLEEEIDEKVEGVNYSNFVTVKKFCEDGNFIPGLGEVETLMQYIKLHIVSNRKKQEDDVFQFALGYLKDDGTYGIRTFKYKISDLSAFKRLVRKLILSGV